MNVRILLLFHDDSSLFVALEVHKAMAKRDVRADFLFIDSNPGRPSKMSENQLSIVIDGKRVVHRRPLYRAFDERILKRYDAVLSAKFPVSFRHRAIKKSWCFRKRPCFVALFPGIEFFPQQGFKNRGMFDVIALNNVADLELYKNMALGVSPPHQQKIVFNPALEPRDTHSSEMNRTDIVFFPQSVTPALREGRRDVLIMLAELARTNPNLRIVIKLRHLENENQDHTHVEEHSYQSISRELGLCSLLHFRTGSMDALLMTCAYAITCSSTAGLESVARNIPTAFLTGFSGYKDDELALKAKVKFNKSGLLVDISDVHLLNLSTGSLEWRSRNLSGVKGSDLLLMAIDHFHSYPPKAVGVTPILRGLIRTIKEHFSGDLILGVLKNISKSF